MYTLSCYFCFWWFGLVVWIPRWLFYLHEASSVNCKTASEAMIVVWLVVPWPSPPAIGPSMVVPVMVWLLLLWWSVVPQSASLLDSQVLSLA